MIRLPKGTAIISNDNDTRRPQHILLPDGSRVAIATERGKIYERRRKDNEDSVAVGCLEVDGELMTVSMVGDGVGGAGQGRISSHILLNIFSDLCESEGLNGSDSPIEDFVCLLIEDFVHRAKPHDRRNEWPCTALVMSFVFEGFLTFAHLGDCRAILFDAAGKIIQQSKDHNPEDPDRKHMLTRCLSVRRTPDRMMREVDYAMIDLEEEVRGSCLQVLVSDGIIDNTVESVENLCSKKKMETIVQRHLEKKNREKKVCSALMDSARGRMARTGRRRRRDSKPDNSTVLVHSVRGQKQFLEGYPLLPVSDEL
jgi:serine/threonine protein phosphatase PrpC